MNFPNHRSWVGVISAMIIWALWFIVVYGLSGVGCDAGWQQYDVAGGNLLSLLMLVCTLLALTLIGWCARQGLHAWRFAGRGAEAGVHDVRQRQRFMGLVMLLLSLLAALGTVMTALPILMLDPCATT